MYMVHVRLVPGVPCSQIQWLPIPELASFKLAASAGRIAGGHEHDVR